MKIELAKRRDGTRLTVDGPERCMVVVGRNGAGKTRFTESLVDNAPGTAVALSAPRALWQKGGADTRPGSADNAYVRLPGVPPMEDTTPLERLVTLVVRDEVEALMQYKAGLRRGRPAKAPRPSVLDKVLELWTALFEGTSLAAADGSALTVNTPGGEEYSVSRLSAGEKAVLYHAASVLLAPAGATLFVDNPTALLHPSVAKDLWTRLEDLRPDCPMVYTTHDLDFVASRRQARIVWVKAYDKTSSSWDYELLPRMTAIPETMYIEILGQRRPVLFIEGDDTHSIDARLYGLVFGRYTVRPLGSCDKVIECVRSFNDLQNLHHLASWGIVDRDRRDPGEVAYLNRRRVLVPSVAEVENLLMLDEVVRAVASAHGRDEDAVSRKVKGAVTRMFEGELRAQALMHTRHRVKKAMEYKVDGRFASINDFERHIDELVDAVDARGTYEKICREFRDHVRRGDYEAVLRVYNRKTMIAGSNAAALCGVKGEGRRAWIDAVLGVLASDTPQGRRIEKAVLDAFGLEKTDGVLRLKAENDKATPDGDSKGVD